MDPNPSPSDGEAILLHHFDDLPQQHESSILGMWAFLATEVMFFGGLFLAYTVYRDRYHDAFAAASRHLSVLLGGINTVVLLTSSLTMALAVRESQLRRARPLVMYLVATLGLGIAFLGIKAIEWTTDYHEHLVPGLDFDWPLAQGGRHVQGGEELSSINTPRREAERVHYQRSAAGQLEHPDTRVADHAELFFVLYFFMTGLHGLHLIIGIVLLAIMALLAQRGWLSGSGETQIEASGLYWHFIDIVWIFLYPLLYLIDVRS
jgi:cytochrome c oxidase subunit 3